MNNIFFTDYDTFEYDYKTLTNLNQAFVDTIRNSGGNNIERLLIITGANDDLELSCSSEYKMPVDKSNKLAISIHYFIPYDFVFDYYFEPFNMTNYEGTIYTYTPKLIWGNFLEYHKLFEDFQLMKSFFIDKGIPIIISEVGVLTEEKKEIESIREYLYMLFSLSSDYNGIMCCLWDTSNKMHGDMNFYDRTNDVWYDEKIKNNFLEISKGRYIKPKDYFINTTFESSDTIYDFESLMINFQNRKVLKIFINIKLTGVLFKDIGLYINTENNDGLFFNIDYGKDNIKKQYDGTSIISIDVSEIDCYNYIKATITWGTKYITLNNMTLEYEESFLSIDDKSLKNAISKYIY